MPIDIEQARKVAHLARIKLDERDLEDVAKQLSSILEFMEQLGEVDVDGVDAMTAVTPMRLKRREDIVGIGGSRSRILSNAPDSKQGFFVVPKVVE